ncbi:hypothetical protein B0H63DRAFT_456205 [Podospora didyma]|uniref:Uncharacterized protein n=1 Tax=Podospora didyma TaxID=330526 RepID=A0AAE0N187_9PEZI|nr:hypothetical protein B0H63DRAFT_456205 [Podospora didyma]
MASYSHVTSLEAEARAERVSYPSICGIEETVGVLLASYRHQNTLVGGTKLLDRMFEDWHFIRYDLRDAKSIFAALLERRGWKLDKSPLAAPPGGRGGENELKAIQAEVGSLKNTVARLGEQMMAEHPGEHEKGLYDAGCDLKKYTIKAERILETILLGESVRD